jgi:hypothetical protein
MSKTVTETPILDQGGPIPPLDSSSNGSTGVRVLSLIAGLGLWLVVVLNLLFFLAHPFWTLFTLIAGYSGYCLLHESGHAIGALLEGHQLMLFKVGPVSLARQSGGLQLKFDLKQFFGGGCVAALPSFTGVSRGSLLVIFCRGTPDEPGNAAGLDGSVALVATSRTYLVFATRFHFYPRTSSRPDAARGRRNGLGRRASVSIVKERSCARNVCLGRTGRSSSSR